ncbi:hypothetical protein B0H10DRAFT_2233427 [Mycena sp. CBHHK59/15]|nr:hypothetical protein B0H10DRAFT_2233427 [Mycena sp. CBHHK59/15]
MAPADPPILSEEEEQIIGDLCSDALFAAWNEDSAHEDVHYHLRQLWKTALRYGFGHGLKEGRLLGRKEVAPTVAKELERERVWGFDVGWKLCSELQQSRASQASLVLPSLPSPRSLSVVSAQADAATVTIAAPVDVSPAPAPLDWGEDASTLPTSPLRLSAAVRKFAAAPPTLSTTPDFILVTKSFAADAFYSPTAEKIDYSCSTTTFNTIVFSSAAIYRLPHADFIPAVRQTRPTVPARLGSRPPPS